MCGIVGIASHTPVAAELLDSLIHLQHRGQDAAGILTADERFYPKHGLGLVREIFDNSDIQKLKGCMGIAHTRYPTAGGNNEVDIQPMWLGSPRGISLAHNGNLTNYQALADHIRLRQYKHLNSSSDSEALLHILGDALAAEGYAEQDELFFDQLSAAVTKLYHTVNGSFAVVALVIGKGLIAFRDPHGIRPLVMGRRPADTTALKSINNPHYDYIFSSETTPFYALGFETIGDLAPGEVAFVSHSGKLFRRKLLQTPLPFRPCVFEYVYFARPDATLDGVNVYRARLRMGQNLAKQWAATYPDSKPDVVIPAPFTANTAALSFAHELNVRYSEGLYKNPFIGRTFIMPDQQTRSRHVRYKLTPQQTEIHGKTVLILDDSIVRGTTSREIVKMVRENGARSIYFVSTCPPLKHPCFYGIDVPSSEELIAATHSHQDICAFLGVDRLLYQTEADLIEAVTRRGPHEIERPCMACMDGDYVCGKLSGNSLKSLEEARQQARRSR